jgi:hypothetical protein
MKFWQVRFLKTYILKIRSRAFRQESQEKGSVNANGNRWRSPVMGVQ